MRRIIDIALVGVITAAIVLGQGASSERRRSTERVIRQVDQERIQAQIDADMAAPKRIYAEDFVGVGPSGTV
jgi:hypothetical protein